jgi:hypothetical protein
MRSKKLQQLHEENAQAITKLLTALHTVLCQGVCLEAAHREPLRYGDVIARLKRGEVYPEFSVSYRVERGTTAVTAKPEARVSLVDSATGKTLGDLLVYPEPPRA